MTKMWLMFPGARAARVVTAADAAAGTAARSPRTAVGAANRARVRAAKGLVRMVRGGTAEERTGIGGACAGTAFEEYSSGVLSRVPMGTEDARPMRRTRRRGSVPHKPNDVLGGVTAEIGTRDGEDLRL